MEPQWLLECIEKKSKLKGNKRDCESKEGSINAA
jgi:hypothetical protein